MTDKLTVLHTYFGYPAFRPGQEAVIDAILSGRDVLAILPTGGGKSLCYQVPAMLLPGMTLVVSPLISLMNDQVGALLRRGIPAALLTSEQTAYERRGILARAARGDLKLLYVSPERLLSASFIKEMQHLPVSLLAVDEAHTVAAWGSEFRPAYREIAGFAASLPSRPVMAAFTATATPAVREEIVRLTGLDRPFFLAAGFDRPNLFYAVRRTHDRDADLLALLRSRMNVSGIIYCMTRLTVDAVTRTLLRAGIPAVRYHAGLPGRERRENQELWLSGKAGVIVATNAFGMGIDKPDVRYVIHLGLPLNIENYYQEAGRAGRDGQPSECILLTRDLDVRTGRFFIKKTASKDLRRTMLREFNAMREYAGGHTCLRAFLLHYFGENAPLRCGRCSVCLTEGAAPVRPPEHTFDHGLYRSLIAVRLRIADERHILPCKVFPNEILRCMAVRKPVRMRDLLAFEGIRPFAAIKYGADFLTEIRTWILSH